jgi:hypothetical protein
MSGFVAESRWRHLGLGSGSRDSGHRKPRGRAIGSQNQWEDVCAKMRYAAGIGPPDVVKATCPVRGALGGNPLSRGSTDAVLRLHSGQYNMPDNHPCDLVSQ